MSTRDLSYGISLPVFVGDSYRPEERGDGQILPRRLRGSSERFLLVGAADWPHVCSRTARLRLCLGLGPFHVGEGKLRPLDGSVSTRWGDTHSKARDFHVL